MRLSFGTERNLYAAARPLAVARNHVVGDEDNLGMPANELILVGIGRRSNQRQHRFAIGRCDGQPSFAGLEDGVGDEPEAELIQIKAKASLLVADEHLDAMHAEDVIRRLGRRTHERDYKAVNAAEFLTRRVSSYETTNYGFSRCAQSGSLNMDLYAQFCRERGATFQSASSWPSSGR